MHNLGRTRELMLRRLVHDPKATQRRSWQLLERFHSELLQMDIEDVLKVGIHEVPSWIVDSQDELCVAIHDDYLDPLIRASPDVCASPPSLQSQRQV